MRTGLRFAFVALVAIASVSTTIAARAEEEITLQLDMKDGVLTPNPLVVPANKKFRLEVTNSGTTPAEFESVDLRKEKVLAPGVKSVIVFRPLDPGEYAFFDDFHTDTSQSKMIAK